MTSASVDNRLPPPMVLRVLNPCMRLVLRTPLGRAIPFGLVGFTGRRSGRRFIVPVGVHVVDGLPHVFTPAAWRVNIESRTPITLTHRGRRTAMLGTLVRDPDAVAAALNTVLAGGTAPRMVGLCVPAGRVTAEDVRTVDKAMIVLRRA